MNLAGFEPATSALRSNRSLHHRSGNRFVGERSSTGQATPSQSIATRTRDTTALARPPPRYDACAGWIRTSFFQSEVSALFTTDKLYPGERATQARVDLKSKYPASSPPGIQNSPLFPHDKGFGAAGNKNPSGAWLGGVRTIELKNGLSPFHLHEKARARRHRLERTAQIRSAASVYKALCFSSAFSVSRAPIAREGRGV